MGIPLNINWQQILLHVFNFILLTGGLYFLLYSPIKKFIGKRAAHYQEIAQQADEKLKAAEMAEEKAKAMLKQADDEITERRMKAEAAINERSAAQLKETEKEAQKIITGAKKSAMEDRKAILESADKEIISMAKEAAAKLVHSSTEDAYRNFLDAAERDESDA